MVNLAGRIVAAGRRADGNEIGALCRKIIILLIKNAILWYNSTKQNAILQQLAQKQNAIL